jgi:hypothetical protein
MKKIYFLLFLISVCASGAALIVPPFKNASSTDLIPRSTAITHIYGNNQGFSLGIGETAASTGQLDVVPSSSSTVGEIIKGAASQSADLLDFDDSSSDILTKIQSDGSYIYAAFNQTVGNVKFFNSTSTLSTTSTPAFFGSSNIINYTAGPLFGFPSTFFLFGASINATTANMTLAEPIVYQSSPIMTANSVVWTGLAETTAGIGSFVDSPTFATAATGSFTGMTHVGFKSNMKVNSGTIASRAAIFIQDGSGSGALTTQSGLKIANLTYGTSQNTPIWVLGTGSNGSRHQPMITIGADANPTAYLDVIPAATTGTVVPDFQVTSPANTNLTASTERFDVNFNLNRTEQWAAGGLTTQRFVVFQPPTLGFTNTSTVTNTATVAISGAPAQGTNALVTNTHGLLIQAGAVSTATASYGLTVNAQTGATNNYAAQFLGGNVGIGGAAPSSKLTMISGTFEEHVSTLTFSATISVDATLGNIFNLNTAATSAATLNFAAAPKAGTYKFILLCDATNRTFTFGTSFKPSSTHPCGASSKTLVFTCVSDGTSCWESAIANNL